MASCLAVCHGVPQLHKKLMPSNDVREKTNRFQNQRFYMLHASAICFSQTLNVYTKKKRNARHPKNALGPLASSR